MILQRFRVQIILRIVLLTGTVGLCFYLGGAGLAAGLALAILAALYQVYNLVRYVEGTHQNLSRFLLAVRYADFSQSFSRNRLGAPFRELDDAFAEVIAEFQKHRMEKEIQAHYLETIIQHLGIGLVAYLPDGTVELVNRAAKRLLGVPRLAHLDALRSLSPELLRVLVELKPGQRNLVQVAPGGEPVQLAVGVTEFKQHDRLYRLAFLQDIHGELEEKESEAWQNLIRVLTHEIMNSMTPIASLAATASDMFAAMQSGDGREAPGEPEQIEDLREALQTIHKRSRGLMAFVQAYRRLTHIPPPCFQVIRVQEAFTRMQHLMQDRLSVDGIAFAAAVDPESLELTADPEMLDQVLLNLLINAADAVRGRPDPRVELGAWLGNHGRVVIQVRDNGCGITEEAQAKIFIPFFTTKKDGSGIGLSLSRRIMRLHRGSISVQSRPDEGAAFRLVF